MPYLQLDLEAKKLVPRVARALGVPDAQIGWGLIELWDWCWNEKRDVVPAFMLHGFFGQVERDALTSALVGFGFLEAAEGGFRIRGAERYLRISEAQREAGKKHSGNLKRGKKLPGLPGGEPEGEPETTSGSAPALTPNTDHRTPKEENPPTPQGGAEVTVLHQESLLTPQEQEATSDVARVMAHYVEAMGAQGIQVRDTPKRRKLVAARLKDHPPDELVEAINGLTFSDYHLRGGYTDIEYAIRDDRQIDLMKAKAREGNRVRPIRL